MVPRSVLARLKRSCNSILQSTIRECRHKLRELRSLKVTVSSGENTKSITLLEIFMIFVVEILVALLIVALLG